VVTSSDVFGGIVADEEGADRSVSATFAPHAQAPGQARAWVRAAMTEWEVDDPDGMVLLALSELATNAVVHGGSDFTVRVSCEPGGLVIGVRDRSPAAPVQLVFSAASEWGRGLGIVRALASDTGVEEHGAEGKTVWARIPVGGPAGDTEGHPAR